MSEQNHSPLPWKWDGMRHYDDYGRRFIEIESSDREYVIGEWGGMSDEDAAFIVRAVNSHDQLVESVKALLGCMSLAGWEDDYVAVQARAALAAAGESHE